MVVFLLKHGQAEALPEDAGDEMRNFDHITTSDSVRDVMEDPAFAGFSPLLLPSHSSRSHGDTLLRGIDFLLPYHSHINADTTIEVLNYMIDEVSAERTIFYDFYTKRQQEEDPRMKLDFSFSVTPA